MRELMLPALALLALGGCTIGRDHGEARALIAQRCATCHIVPGVAEATGRVGPSLTGIAGQQIIAGRFANGRETLMRWVAHPQAMQPGSAMPDTGLTRHQAEVIADYLITLERP